MGRLEWTGLIIALAVFAAMGILVYSGPYHKVNKPPASAARSNFPTQHVKIVTNPKTVGEYTPKSITLHVGQRVVFTNVSNAPHTVTANNRSFDSQNIDTGGQSWTYTAASKGTFPYFCIYHPLMHGTIVVQS